MPTACAIAMGKFESIHLGHQALIAEMIKIAKVRQLASALLVFEPHPYRVLVDANYEPLLTSRQREHLVAKLGVDYLIEYPFDRALAALSPVDFCKLLCNDLKAQAVVVGEGYRFGHNREGDVQTLSKLAIGYGATVHEVTPLYSAQIAPLESQQRAKISTSVIRELLMSNKLHDAEVMLGHKRICQAFSKNA